MDAFLNPAAFHELPSVPPSPFLAAGEMATGYANMFGLKLGG